MPRKNSMEDINVWQSSYTMDELQQMRRILAKRANQRIVRLERAESLVTGETLGNFGAIEKVNDYLSKQGKEGKLRFSERQHVAMTNRELKREISELQNFLLAKTSKVSGAHKIEKMRIETFAKKGISFGSNKEFYDFLNSDVYQKAIAGFDSHTIVDVYDKARKVTDLNGEEVYNDDKVSEIIMDYLSEKDVTVKGLYEKFGLKPTKGV